MDNHFLKSSFREKLIEHLFIGEMLKLSWKGGSCSIEVAKPEVDNQGYDLILEHEDVIRHVQLKTAHRNAKTAKQKVHLALNKKPSGCVIWIYFNEETLELGPFLFFGADPKQPLPCIEGMRVAKHTKANAQGIKNERPEIREIPKGQFLKLATAEDLYAKLFCY
ncbi:MAG: hypothetical protein OIF55_17335 [Amphritea sp.]|nr:hypothetical protein [Amphritea sp.]